MKLGLDYDDTITKAPEFFKLLAEAVRGQGGQAHIVSSRTDSKEVRDITTQELDSYGIKFDRMFLFPHTSEQMMNICPHKELDWYKKWLWQKVDYCKKNKIDIFFDDDQKVIELFEEYLPQVKMYKACGKKY